ncbi:MAG: MoaD/ThiS family protein [Pyrinomonadaceae bacterium]
MKIKVLFFGATAESVGLRETRIVLEDGSKTSVAVNFVKTSFPNLAKFKNLLVAVNQKYSTGEESLVDGDELAIFTSVSGG